MVAPMRNTIVVTSLAALAACAGGAPITEADRAILEQADAIAAKVSAARELPLKRPIAKEVMAREELGAMLERELEGEDGKKEIDAEQRFLRAVGLLPRDSDLGALYRALLGSQIAGYYDPKDRTLRCISSDIAVLQRLTLVHEIYHGLQDQYFPLDPLMKGAEGVDLTNDAARARQALVEGDAQHFTMSVYAAQHADEIRSDVANESGRELFGFGLEQALAQAAMPPYFLENLGWAYTAGAEFVAAVRADMGWAGVAEAFAKPPRSTEQIVHPEKYLRGGDEPIAVVAAAPAFARGWRELGRDTQGEATIAALLGNLGQDPIRAKRGSQGWGGDQALILETPAGAELLVWRLAWDSENDAAEFFAAWRRVLTQELDRSPPGRAHFVGERDLKTGSLEPVGRDAPPIPAAWREAIALPDGSKLAVGESGDGTLSLLFSRGRGVVLLRGAIAEAVAPNRVAALAEELFGQAK